MRAGTQRLTLALLLTMLLGAGWWFSRSDPQDPSTHGSIHEEPPVPSGSRTHDADKVPVLNVADTATIPTSTVTHLPSKETESSSTSLIEHLVDELRSSNESTWTAAAKRAEKLDAQGGRALIAAAVEACAQHDATPPWVWRLHQPLRSMGEEVVGALAEAIGHEQAYFWAAATLNNLAPFVKLDSITPTLIEHLRSESTTAQYWASIVLRHAGPRRVDAVRELATLLASEHQGVRGAAAETLGGMGPAAAFALEALERRLEVLGEQSGGEVKALRKAHRQIRGD